MKYLIRAEEAVQFAATIFLFNQLPLLWWLYPAWFFAPDLSMLGYLVNPKVGAFTYNIVHHKGVAVAIYLVGLYMNNTELLFTGLVLFGHSAFDRLCGYGLKFPDDFKHTHLGWIGKQ